MAGLVSLSTLIPRFISIRANSNRFSNKDMIADPLTAQYCENGDTFNGWIGPDMHFRES